ncbi:MAG: hypothetical protein PHO65_07385 [Sulfurovum sp.]|nr:hypothetical protein [Sulfurovum sp.]
MNQYITMMSAVTAAVVMTGCGGGSSASEAPSYSTQDAKIETVETVEATVQTLNAGLEGMGMGAVPRAATKATTHTVIKDNILTKATGKKMKTAFEVRAKTKMAEIKSTMIAQNACEPDEYTETYECSENGSEIETWSQTPGSNPGECIVTYKATASNCHDKDIWGDSSWDDTVNGSMITTEIYILDNEGSWNQVSYKEDADFVSEGTETYTPTEGEGYTSNYKNDVDYVLVWEDEYTFSNDVFTYNNTYRYEEKADIKVSYDEEESFTAAYRSDMAYAYEEQENVSHMMMHGYADVRYAFGTADEGHFSFAGEDLRLTYGWSPEIMSFEINGKVGSACTGGLITIDTNRTIEDNTTDEFELPNDGLINLQGASGTTASLEFYKDGTGTHARATIGEQSKTYDSYEALNGEACEGEFFNPYF